MQNVFNIVNYYVILLTPLILYILISRMYLVISATNGKFINLIFALLLFVLMTSAFIAGWFNMIKSAVEEQKQEDANLLIKKFLPGVGEYFLSSTGAFLISILMISLFLLGGYYIGMHTIGDIGISTESFTKAFQTTESIRAFVSSLSVEQLIKINMWNLIIISFFGLSQLLIFLYLPALFYKNKNPFIAFYLSLKDLFSKKIFKTISIFLLIQIANIILSFISALTGSNMILYFVFTLLNFYFIALVGVGLFYYYYNNFIKPFIGQNIDIEI